jgi:hypothetical protein
MIDGLLWAGLVFATITSLAMIAFFMLSMLLSFLAAILLTSLRLVSEISQESEIQAVCLAFCTTNLI